MPKMPPTFDPRGTRQERKRATNRDHDRTRANVPWRSWYSSPRWRTLRAFILRRDPSCRMCLYEGQITPSSHVDHLEEHGGDEVLFWDYFNLWGLCSTHHNSTKQRIENMRRAGSTEQVKKLYTHLRKIYASTVQHAQE